MVEHVLAKDEMGVRFSLPAQPPETPFPRTVFLLLLCGVEKANYFAFVENRKAESCLKSLSL